MTHKKSSLNSLIIKAILLAFSTSVLIISLITVLWGSHTLTHYLKRDSEANSKLVFASLQTLMSKGTTHNELQAYVDKLNAFYPDRTIRLNTQPTVKHDQIWVEDLGSAIRINYPVIIEHSCLACHANHTIGDQKAIIEYSYPIKEVFSRSVMLSPFWVSLPC